MFGDFDEARSGKKNVLILICLGLLGAVGFTLLILGCALYHKWWPLLAFLGFATVPMPLLFCFGRDSRAAQDWAMFLTGLLFAAAIGIFVVLGQFQAIQWEAFGFSLGSLGCFVIMGALFKKLF